MNTCEDIRWTSTETGQKITYIESLKAELKHRNTWICPSEWAAIERWLPTITEDEAKEQCFIIRDKIRARVNHHQHQYN
jgi:hypothetical protein